MKLALVAGALGVQQDAFYIKRNGKMACASGEHDSSAAKQLVGDLSRSNTRHKEVRPRRCSSRRPSGKREREREKKRIPMDPPLRASPSLICVNIYFFSFFIPAELIHRRAKQRIFFFVFVYFSPFIYVPCSWAALQVTRALHIISIADWRNKEKKEMAFLQVSCVTLFLDGTFNDRRAERRRDDRQSLSRFASALFTFGL